MTGAAPRWRCRGPMLVSGIVGWGQAQSVPSAWMRATRRRRTFNTGLLRRSQAILLKHGLEPTPSWAVARGRSDPGGGPVERLGRVLLLARGAVDQRNLLMVREHDARGIAGER